MISPLLVRMPAAFLIIGDIPDNNGILKAGTDTV